MQILLKLFLLLININQETVLTFFGTEDPNHYLDVTSEGASVSTAISLETLKLLFQGFIEQYQSGLGLIDIENILLFITFIRFIILASQYNIKTSLYISCISLLAGFLWYTHLKDLYNWYGDMLTYNRLTSRFGQEARNQDYMLELKRQSRMYLDFINQNPLSFVKSTFVHASEKDGYRLDPISMLVARVPESYKYQIERGYYYLYSRILPGTCRIIGSQIQELGPLVLYVWIVRLNKKYCPYLIRWHWTYIVIGSIFETEFIRILYRLFTYYNHILVPQGRLDEAIIIEHFFAVSVTTHYFLVCLGMLHAVCGQYFYIPFLTENTELHIGKRPQNSIYSGGYTSWQEGGTRQIEIITKNRKFFIFPRIWWGWLGKDNTTSNTFNSQGRKRNRLKAKRKKRLKKLIQKLKKWILRS